MADHVDLLTPKLHPNGISNREAGCAFLQVLSITAHWARPQLVHQLVPVLSCSQSDRRESVPR